MTNNMFHFIHDNKNLRNLLATIISNAGYYVHCFNFAEHYLQLFKALEFEKPIAVSSQINLPRISGDKGEYFQLRDFGIDHNYPFYKVIRLNRKP